MGETRFGEGGMLIVGRGGDDSSGEESVPWTNGLGVGDWVALALPLKSLDPLDRDRERERRFVRTIGSGVVAVSLPGSESSATSGVSLTSGVSFASAASLAFIVSSILSSISRATSSS